MLPSAGFSDSSSKWQSSAAPWARLTKGKLRQSRSFATLRQQVRTFSTAEPRENIDQNIAADRGFINGEPFCRRPPRKTSAAFRVRVPPPSLQGRRRRLKFQSKCNNKSALAYQTSPNRADGKQDLTNTDSPAAGACAIVAAELIFPPIAPFHAEQRHVISPVVAPD